MKRPPIVRQRYELETEVKPPSANEVFGFASEFSPATNMSYLRAAHLRLPPGVRAYPPVALADDEVFFLVLEGAPDLWLDGFLHRLGEGDGGTFNPGTGIGHAILNNSSSEVRLFVMTDLPRTSSRAHHSLDSGANENLQRAGRLWADPPKRDLGPHDGLTDAQRGKPGPKAAKAKRKPTNVAHWKSRLEKKPSFYPNSDEAQGISASYSKPADFSRIGVHVEVLKPGRRTSWPHAERDEEEFVYLAEGEVDCWLDGHVYPMAEGDFVGWRAGTGLTHVIMNNSRKDALLIVGGEASRYRSRCWYPFHPHRQKEMGDNFWADHPVPKLGPHDGMPDALRARVPKSARKSALSRNTAAIKLSGKAKRR
jgi:uncharacterized cupin superfamily protein